MDQSRLHQVTDKKYSKTTFVIMAIFISIIVAQNVFYTLLLDDNLSRELSSFWGIMLFASLAAASYGLGWYILSHFVRQTDTEAVDAKSRYFNSMYKAVRIIFYLTAVILAIIVFQMALILQYNIILSLAAMASSTILAATIMAVLSYRFLSWFRSKRDLSILLYGLAFAITAVGAGMMSLTNTVAFLIDGLPTREEPSGSVEDFTKAISKSSTRSELFQIALMPYRLAFGLYWIGTVLLLRHYSKSFGRLKFWTVVSLPLVNFIIGNIFFSSSHFANSFAFDVIVSLTTPTAAILYAVTFFTMARSMKRTGHNTLAAHYLIISGYGIILLLATASSSPHFVDYEQTPYPPFATASWSFLGFAAYLFSIGY
ncbi:MAG TPA: hypothetical protein VKA09_14780 [Nitrososphaeraceae archaeon]|nr:hypothetical protein [Nitrososphaeraceae archaeon]